MIKKMLLTTVTASALLLSACAPATQSTEDDGKIDIIATSFHEYDWAREIIGENTENINLTYLMENGVDLHSYEPSVEDISKISSADLFIYNGGPSHSWVEDIVNGSINENLVTVNVMETLGDAVKMEVAVEGMQVTEHNHDHNHAEEDHDHAEEDHDHAEEDTHTDHDVAAHEDEHVWLSLNNAILICNIIEGEISKLDPDNESIYKANVEAYTQTLEELDVSFEEAIELSERDTLVFTDRFPFLYMMQDYDVNYYAAFQGCSAETEASFETIAFLADKVTELDINTLLILENGMVELAQTVNNNSEDKDSEILELNSIQAVSKEAVESGTTYYKIMEENLQILKTALS